MDLAEEIIAQIIGTMTAKGIIKKKNIWQVKVLKGPLNSDIITSLRFNGPNYRRYLLSVKIDVRTENSRASFHLSQLCKQRLYSRPVTHYTIELPSRASLTEAFKNHAIKNYFITNKQFPSFVLTKAFGLYLSGPLIETITNIENEEDRWPE